MGQKCWTFPGILGVILTGCASLQARPAVPPSDCITIDGEAVPLRGAASLADALRMHLHGGRLGRQIGGPPLLYVDGLRADATSDLGSISVMDIESVTLVRGAEATARFGAGGIDGAVLVRTRPPGAPPPCGIRPGRAET